MADQELKNEGPVDEDPNKYVALCSLKEDLIREQSLATRCSGGTPVTGSTLTTKTKRGTSHLTFLTERRIHS